MMKSSVVLIVFAAAIAGSFFIAYNDHTVQETKIRDLDTKLNTLEQAYADLKTELEGLPAGMATDRLSAPGNPPPTTEPTPEPTPEPEPEYLLFENDQYAYSFFFQRNWSLDEGNRQGASFVTFSSPERKLCNDIKSECFASMSLFTIEVVPNPEPADLEEYFNKAVADLQEQYAITSTSKSPTTYIADVKAYGINYVTRDERGNPVEQVKQIYTIIDEKAFILTYSAPYSVSRDNLYDTYLEDALHIVDSFNVTRIYKPVIKPIG
jgi:hypothetical protein